QPVASNTAFLGPPGSGCGGLFCFWPRFLPTPHLRAIRTGALRLPHNRKARHESLKLFVAQLSAVAIEIHKFGQPTVPERPRAAIHGPTLARRSTGLRLRPRR